MQIVCLVPAATKAILVSIASLNLTFFGRSRLYEFLILLWPSWPKAPQPQLYSSDCCLLSVDESLMASECESPAAMKRMFSTSTRYGVDFVLECM